MDQPWEEKSLLDTEAEEAQWADYIGRFRNQIYPTFQVSGFSLPEAFNAWMLNRLNNSIHHLVKYLEQEIDPDAEVEDGE